MITIEIFVKTVFVMSFIFCTGLVVFLVKEEIKSKRNKVNEWSL